MRHRLAGCHKAIVTTHARTLHFVVIHRSRRCPARAHVAGLAEIRGGDVRHTLASCRGSIVTSNAGICCRAVIKSRDQPTTCSMTIITGRSGWNMGR